MSALSAAYNAGAADVTYVGPSSGTWNVGTNWTGGAVPSDATFNVTIPNNFAVTFNRPGSTTINALTLGGPNTTLSLSPGSNLTVLSAFSGSGQANVTGASFMVNGTVNGDGSGWRAESGGTIDLPGLSTYLNKFDYTGRRFTARNAGSRISATNLTSMAANATSNGIYLEAQAGGLVDLRSVNNVTLALGDTFSVAADGAGSTINLSALANLPTNNVVIDLSNGATLLWNNPTALKGATFSVTGSGVTVNTSTLANLDNSSLSAEGGAQYALPAFTTYTGTFDYTTDSLTAEGAGSRLRATNLATVNVNSYSGQYSLIAKTGGRLDAGALTNVNLSATGRLLLLADGAGSIVDVSALSTLPTNGVTVDLRNGGTVLWNNPTALKGGALFLTGAGNTINVSSLANIDNTTLDVSGGGVLTLGAVTGVTHQFSATDEWTADGTGSRVNMTNLASVSVISDYAHLDAVADNAGYVDLRNLTTAGVTGYASDFELRAVRGGTVDARGLANVAVGSNGAIQFYADGAGSTVIASALTTLPTARVQVDLRNGGSLLWNNPTALKNGSITFTGAGNVLNVSALANVDGTGLAAYSGATLALPAVHTYALTLGAQGVQFRSEGANSLVSLSNVASLSIADNYSTLDLHTYTAGKIDLRNVTTAAVGVNSHLLVEAEGGGQIDLRNLATVNLANAGRLTLYANGAGSLINLSGLSNFPTAGVSIDLRGGGTLQWNNPTAFRNGSLSFTGAGNTLNVAPLADVDASNLYAYGGAVLALPVSAYAIHTPYTGREWYASGAGSTIGMSNVATIQVSDIYSSLTVRPDAGGKVDLRNLTSIDLSAANARVDFQARTGARIDISKLTSMTAVPTASFRFYASGSNSLIDASLLSNLPANALTVALENGGTLLWNNPTSFKGGSLSLTGTGNTIALASLANVDNTELYAGAGAQYGLTGVTAYATDIDYLNRDWHAEQANSRLSLSNLASIDLKAIYNRLDVFADTGATIDLKNLSSVTRNPVGTGVTFTARGTNGLIDAPRLVSGSQFGLPLPGGVSGLTSVSVTNGGQVNLRELGNLPALDVTGATSRATVDGSVFTPAAGTLKLASAGTLAVRRDFGFSGTAEANFNTTTGTLALDGSGLQRLEVGGLDAGTAIANLTNDNFGLGRLVVGGGGQPTIAEVRDDLNNGNRNGTGGAAEALYLFGPRGRTTAPQAGDAPTVDVLGGSTLLIGDKNVYVRSATGVVNLQSLFTGNARLVPYAGGYVSKSLSAVPGAWAATTGGNWSANGNWLVNKPGAAAGGQAVFGDSVGSAAVTVNVDQSVNLGLLGFDGPGSYTLDGAGPITLGNANGLRGGVHVRGGATGAGGNHVVNTPVSLAADLDLVSYSTGLLDLAGPLNNPDARFLTKTGTGTIVLSGPQSHGAGTTFVVGEGTLRLNADVAGTSGNRTAVLRTLGGGTLHVGATQHVDRVEVVGGKVTVDRGGVGALPPGSPVPVVVTNALSVSDTGVVEFGRGGMVVDYAPGQSPATTIRELLRRGYNAGGGTPWSGTNGIRTILGVSGPDLGVGYGEASRLLGPAGGTFLGVPVDGTAILLRYTKPGDANLDGQVDFGDLVALAQHYNTGAGGAPLPWSDGDFNYDGYVDFLDLVSLAQFYNQPVDPTPGLPVPAGAPAGFAEQWARAQAADPSSVVPEPAAWSLLSLATTAALTKRRRRGRGPEESAGRAASAGLSARPNDI